MWYTIRVKYSYKGINGFLKGGNQMKEISDFDRFWNDVLEDGTIRKESHDTKNDKNLSVAKQIGDAIIAYRKELGYSQVDFAELVGLTQPVLSKLEKGDGNPTARRLQQILDRSNGTLYIQFHAKEKKGSK